MGYTKKDMPKTNKKIADILGRGIEDIMPDRERLLQVMKKRKIRLYLGIDPTAPQLHLGNAISLRKLRQFQDLGHEVILLFGTFTAQIGDPSGRDKKRQPLNKAQIKKNIATYKKQAAKILDIHKTKITYNHQWLERLSFQDLVRLTSYFTTSRLLERDMFKERLKRKREVWVNEFLYPLMQGYDSVALDADAEIGGSDQTFNMLVGRKLQRIYNKKEKFILTTPLLLGLDGRKMSKTYGNTVNITDSPNEMYGKLMSLRDHLMPHYFELCTDIPRAEIRAMEKEMKRKKVNPRDVKMKLAREIVTMYHGKREGDGAEREFHQVFSEKKLPSEMRKVKVSGKTLSLIEALRRTGLAGSRADAKRLIRQRGVKINGVLQEDSQKNIKVKKGMVFQAGKKNFVKIV